MKRLVCLLPILLGCAPPDETTNGEPEPISILAWNVESGGNDPAVIAEQLEALAGSDVYALSEVSPDNFERYAGVLGSGFQSVEGMTGRGDRLQILYDGDRFELLRMDEMDRYREHVLNNGTHRSPLFVHLRDKASGVDFQLVVNHLARSNEDLRNQQAVGLREWARDQSLPTFTIGDFNMDYDFPTEEGNEAFVEMMRDNVWLWVKPTKLIDTNWADSDGDGKDNYPHSMLDFAFVAGPAKEWTPQSHVIIRERDFPDDETTSDHRPIVLELRAKD